jgi:hypothetical protein
MENRNKKFPEKFTLTDNQRVILEFEKLLRDCGLKTNGTPLEEASLAILEMLEIRKDKSVHNKTVDCRERWRQALFLADMARKIVRVQHHCDFHTLYPHLELLLKPENFSQFSACKISASPKEKETNNKIFELYVAAILLQFCSNLKLDNPNSSKGDNPDVIVEFDSKKWAFACKVSHSENPLAFLQRVRDGVEQIEDEKAKVDRGLIVVNFKNLIPHNEIWRALKNSQTNEWIYESYTNRAAPVIKMRDLFRKHEQQVYDIVGGRPAFVDEFIGKKTIPMVLVFNCTVSGYSPSSEVVMPMISKQMSGLGLPQEYLDSEAAKIIYLFNDYLHDRIE